ELVVAQVEDRAVELAREPQRIPLGASLELDALRTLDGEDRDAVFRLQLDLDESIRSQRGERDAVAAGPVGALRELERAVLHALCELLRLRRVVDEAPLPGAVGAHALGGGAEDIGEVAPHFALVDQPREAAGAG